MNLYKSFLEYKYPDRIQTWEGLVEPVLKRPSEKKANDFIHEMFKSRDKEQTLSFGVFPIKYSRKKSIHIFSAFMLGMLLKDVVPNKLGMQINEFGYISEFEYQWFLSCLYHDVVDFEKKGLNVEKNLVGEKNISDKTTVFDFLNKYGLKLKYDLYKDTLPDVQVNLRHHTYSEELVKNYFNMRLQDNDIEHGIMAGYILYDRLLRNYERAWKNKTKEVKKSGSSTTNEGQNLKKSRFYTETNIQLLWCQEQLWLFGYIADAILAHNIWHLDTRQDETDVQKYLNNDLKQLIHNGCENEGKLDITSDPLAFYLGLIDSIEPVKYFPHKCKNIWERINIELNNRTIVISQNGTDLDFKKWFDKKIRDIPVWLNNVNVELVDNVIRIELL